MQQREKAATGTFLLIRTVSTFLIKGSLKIISFQYLHMLNRLQRSRHNEVKERTIKAWWDIAGKGNSSLLVWSTGGLKHTILERFVLEETLKLIQFHPMGKFTFH